MPAQDLIPHLFRTEFSKICSVLTKTFGIEFIEDAEDIASETFAAALETWAYNGIPENPAAWLYSVAKNKAKNHLNRNKLFAEKIAKQIITTTTDKVEIEIDLSDRNTTDSQLQMLFAICHPSIATEAQIGLALRILCGFGIDEIADAFLTNKETINKRLFRAKKKLRNGRIPIEFPAAVEINDRLDNVITTLYLLFNEGYYSESNDNIIRENLCLEAMRLNYLLLENQQTNFPNVNALFALMCFHASRLDARKNDACEIILYNEQDEALWNQELIAKGAFYLQQASQGNQLSKYHLEATIAYWHTIKTDTKEKWQNILQLYNQLLKIEYSPIAALNRTFALSKVNGKKEAIAEAEKLHLAGNPYYFTFLGELYKGTDNIKAKYNFEEALALAKTNGERLLLQRKIEQL
jgi:RNA polymerase sigma factor (sigma-70 family)